MTPEEIRIYTTANLALAAIGFVFSVLGLGLIVYQNRRSLHGSSGLQLIFGLFLCFVIACLNRTVWFSLQLSNTLPGLYCYFYGPLFQLVGIASFLYESAISIFLYRIIFFEDNATPRWMGITHWLSWSLSLLLTSLPATTSDYHPPDCYISFSPTGSIWRLVTYLALLLIIMVLISILISLVSYRLFRKQEQARSSRWVIMILRIPIIFIICWLPNVIFWLHEFSDSTILQSFGWNLARSASFELHPIFTVLSFSWSSIVKLGRYLLNLPFQIHNE